MYSRLRLNASAIVGLAFSGSCTVGSAVTCARQPVAEAFKRNLEYIDFPEDPDDGQAGYGSTDCGNVSQRLPTIHPYIRISPDGVPGHSREFAEWARSPLARAGMLAGAKALALTALDLLASPEALARAREDFTREGGNA